MHIGAEDALDGKTAAVEEGFFKTAAGFGKRFSSACRWVNRGGFEVVFMHPAPLLRIELELLPDYRKTGDTSEFQSRIGRISRGKYQSINISPFSGSKKTVEFRAFNGTLTPGIIQANVKYAAGVINTVGSIKNQAGGKV